MDDNKENQFLKYKNPDERCRYPFTPDGVGYCWSYANHVDGAGGKYEHMEPICEQCEMFRGGNNYFDAEV